MSDSIVPPPRPARKGSVGPNATTSPADSATLDTPAPIRSPLKRALVEAGEPAWRIALIVGIRPDVLSKIASGAAIPPPEVREKLAAYLSRDEAELFEDVGAHRPTPGDGDPDDRQWDLDGARPAKGVAVSARDQGGRAGGVK